EKGSALPPSLSLGFWRSSRTSGRLPDRAEAFVVDVARDRGLVAADRAVRVAAQLQVAELHLEAVVGHEPADERVPLAENELDGLRGLERPDDPAEDAEDARLLAARREVGRRRLRVEAAVAGAPLDPEL